MVEVVSEDNSMMIVTKIIFMVWRTKWMTPMVMMVQVASIIAKLTFKISQNRHVLINIKA